MRKFTRNIVLSLSLLALPAVSQAEFKLQRNGHVGDRSWNHYREEAEDARDAYRDLRESRRDYYEALREGDRRDIRDARNELYRDVREWREQERQAQVARPCNSGYQWRGYGNHPYRYGPRNRPHRATFGWGF